MDRVKRFLKVDNDDTEELHNKYRETSKDREAKIRLFEEQLNIKVLQIISGKLGLKLTCMLYILERKNRCLALLVKF